MHLPDNDYEDHCPLDGNERGSTRNLAGTPTSTTHMSDSLRGGKRERSMNENEGDEFGVSGSGGGDGGGDPDAPSGWARDDREITSPSREVRKNYLTSGECTVQIVFPRASGVMRCESCRCRDLKPQRRNNRMIVAMKCQTCSTRGVDDKAGQSASGACSIFEATIPAA